MTKKSKKRRRGKQGKSGRTSSRPASKRKLAQAGHRVQAFEISDEVEETYKPGIAEEMADATLLLKTGHLIEARDAFQSVIQREPQIREAYANLAVAYLQLGDQEAAEGLWREAIDMFPRYVFPRANLAQRCLRRGQVDEAESLLKPLEKVRRFHSGEFRFYVLTYCDVLAAQGNYAAALSWLNLLSKALPRSPGVWPRRVRYRIGRLLHRKRPSQSQMG
jgi:tetratricopeptide (TPR) repeat protein